MREHIRIDIDNAGFFLVLSDRINKNDLSVLMYRKGLIPEYDECDDKEKIECNTCPDTSPKPEDYFIRFGCTTVKKGGRFYFAPPKEFLTYPSGWYVAFVFFGEQLVRMVDIELNGILRSTFLTGVERLENCKEYTLPNISTIFDCCEKECDLCCKEETKICGCHEIPCECHSPEHYITVKCKDYSTACQIDSTQPYIAEDVMTAVATLSNEASNIRVVSESPRDAAKVIHLQNKVFSLQEQLKQAITQDDLDRQADMYINHINELTRQYNLLRSSIHNREAPKTYTGNISEIMAAQLSEAYYANKS